MLEDSGEDRRGGLRLNLAVPVTLHVGERTREAHVVNMSCRGFLLLMDELLPPETQFSIEMNLPGTDEILQADCEVVWASDCISILSQVHGGMGVRLLAFRYVKQQSDPPC
jgi:hypothetical protein